MSDSKKTKKQLIDELNALRAKMDPAATKGAADSEGAGQTTGLTRRDVLTAWVAPVILTVPLMPRMAAAAQPGNQVQGTPTQVPGTLFPTPTFQPTRNPTSQPTGSPTSQPTGSPTSQPTPGLTPAPVPTTIPTSTPTSVPTTTPTAFPTVTPTAVIPVELSEFKID